MHLKLDELLALRDDDGAAEAARHVEQCKRCRTELEELEATASALKDLPLFEAPSEAWSEICHRIVCDRRRHKRARLGLVAASLLVAVAATLFVQFGVVNDESKPLGIGETALTVEHLSNASRELELVLREPSLQTQVLSPERAAMIVEIEDRIALVDIVLAQNSDQEPNERTVVLWSDRVQLLDALVTARGGKTKETGVIHAVNRGQGSLQ